MNDNKLGGPGYCPKCCRCVDNLSFHVTICTGIDPKNAFIYKPTDNEMAKDREMDDLQTENYKLRKEVDGLKKDLSEEKDYSKMLWGAGEQQGRELGKLRDDLEVARQELCNIAIELGEMKSERDDLQTTANVLEDDGDRYRLEITALKEELAKAYNTISNLQGDVDDARSEACGLATELNFLKRRYKVGTENDDCIPYDPFG